MLVWDGGVEGIGVHGRYIKIPCRALIYVGLGLDGIGM